MTRWAGLDDVTSEIITWTYELTPVQVGLCTHRWPRSSDARPTSSSGFLMRWNGGPHDDDIGRLGKTTVRDGPLHGSPGLAPKSVHCHHLLGVQGQGAVPAEWTPILGACPVRTTVQLPERSTTRWRRDMSSS